MNKLLEINENHFNCIYKLVSPSGKSYIGQCGDFQHRQLRRLRSYLKWVDGGRVGNGENPALFRAFDAYGVENFTWEILEENLESQEAMDEREIYYISFYDSVKNGYNIQLGGLISSIDPRTGRGYGYRSSSDYSVAWSDDIKAWKREYYQKHKPEIAERHRVRYYNEGGKEKRKERYLANAEKEKAYSRKRYEEHHEEALAYKRDYYAKNREKCLQASRDYCQANKEAIAERKRKKIQENPEEHKRKIREYRKNNREKIEERDRRYRQEHKEELRIKNREYKSKNKEKIKERLKGELEHRKWLRHAGMEFFGCDRTAVCFRRFFGGGRTRSLYFMQPKGLVNEQGCWLFE